MKIALHDSGEEHLQLMRQLGVEYVTRAVRPGLHRVFALEGARPPVKVAHFGKIV